MLTIYVLISWNILVFVLYTFDKRQAKARKSRLSENLLITLAFLAGGIGAYLGVFLVRHKTKHTKFKLLIPIAAVITTALFIFLL